MITETLHNKINYTLLHSSSRNMRSMRILVKLVIIFSVDKYYVTQTALKHCQ